MSRRAIVLVTDAKRGAISTPQSKRTSFFPDLILVLRMRSVSPVSLHATRAETLSLLGCAASDLVSLLGLDAQEQTSTPEGLTDA